MLDFRIQDSMIKCSGTGCSGDQEQRGTDRTLETVGRIVDHRKFIVTLLLGNKGGGTTAVQVNSDVTSCLQHNLSNLLHASAARSGLLTTIHGHEHDFAGLGNTNCRAACTVIGIRIGMGYRKLAILDQRGTKARDAFHDQPLFLQLVVFLSGTNYCSTIFQNTEEAIGIGGMPFGTTHNQKTARFAGGHVITGTVDGNDDVVVGDVVLAFGIAIFCLSCIRLIQNTLHAPSLTGIVVSIVCIHIDIGTGNVGSCNIEHGVLSISGGCLVNFLRNARCQRGFLGGIDRVVSIAIQLYVVTCQFAQVIGERVTASLSHIGDITCLKFSGAFQRCDYAVCGILTEHNLADLVSSGNTTKTVVQEVFCTLLIGEGLSEVILEELIEQAVSVVLSEKLLDHVVTVKVTVHIGKAELIAFTLNGMVEVSFTNLSNHFVNAAGDIMSVGSAQQVNKVACPAGHVVVVDAVLVVVGDVHGAKHMTEVHTVAIWQRKVLDVSDAGYIDHVVIRRNRFVVGIFLILNIFGKCGILITGHDLPGTGVITVNAGTDVLDQQPHGILTGICLDVGICILFKDLQSIHKLVIGFYSGLTQRKNRSISGVVALCASLVSFPTGDVVSGPLSVVEFKIMSVFGYGLGTGAVAVTAGEGFFTGLGTGRQGCYASLVPVMANSLDLSITLGAPYFDIFDRLRAGIIQEVQLTVLTLIAVFPTGHTTLGSLALDQLAGVTRGGDNFLFNQNFGTNRTMFAFGQTSLSTGGCNLAINCLGMTLGRNRILRDSSRVTDRTVLSFGQAGLSTGRCDSRNRFLGVTLGRNLHRCHQSFLTDRTLLARGQTGLGTGGCYCGNRFLGMAQSIDLFLLNQNIAADRAVGAFGQAGFGTGRRNRLIGHLVMTLGTIHFLLNQNIAADRALNTGLQAVFGTGGRDRRNDFIDMTQYINSLLRLGNGATNRALLAFGQTSLGTVGCYCRNHLLDVAQCINNLLRLGSSATNRALLTCGQAGLGTGGCDGRNRFFGVALGGQNFNDRVITVFTLQFLTAIHGTSGKRGRNNHLMGVALHGNYSLCHQYCGTHRAVLAFRHTGCGTCGVHTGINDFAVALGGNSLLFQSPCITDRTLLASSQTGVRTVSFLCRHINFGMAGLGIDLSHAGNFICTNGTVDNFIVAAVDITLRRNRVFNLHLTGGVALGGYRLLSNQNFVTDRAVGTCRRAGIGTGCCNSRVNLFAMPLGRNHFLLNQNFVTDRAMFAFGQTSLGTGGCNLAINYLGMPQNSYRLGLFMSALLTSVGLNALDRTGRIKRHNTFVVAVIQHIRVIRHIAVIPSGTSIGGVTLGSTGGRCHYAAIAMSLGRNNLFCSSSRYFTVFILEHTGTSAANIVCVVARSGTGCLSAANQVHTVAELNHIIIYVAMVFSTFLALRTGVGSVALLRTGGFCHSTAVAVTSCRNICKCFALLLCPLCFKGCGIGSLTFFRTGGILGLLRDHRNRFGFIVSRIVSAHMCCSAGRLVTAPIVGHAPCVVKCCNIRKGFALLLCPLCFKGCSIGSLTTVGTGGILGLLRDHRNRFGFIVSRIVAAHMCCSTGCIVTAPSVGHAPCVVNCSNRFGLGMILGTICANSTGIESYTLCRTGRINRHNAGIIAVTQCRHSSPSNQNLITDRAMLACSQARSGTGSCHGLVNNFSVTQRHIHLCFTACFLAAMAAISDLIVRAIHHTGRSDSVFNHNLATDMSFHNISIAVCLLAVTAGQELLYRFGEGTAGDRNRGSSIFAENIGGREAAAPVSSLCGEASAVDGKVAAGKGVDTTILTAEGTAVDHGGAPGADQVIVGGNTEVSAVDRKLRIRLHTDSVNTGCNKIAAVNGQVTGNNQTIVCVTVVMQAQSDTIQIPLDRAVYGDLGKEDDYILLFGRIDCVLQGLILRITNLSNSGQSGSFINLGVRIITGCAGIGVITVCRERGVSISRIVTVASGCDGIALRIIHIFTLCAVDRISHLAILSTGRRNIFPLGLADLMPLFRNYCNLNITGYKRGINAQLVRH